MAPPGGRNLNDDHRRLAFFAVGLVVLSLVVVIGVLGSRRHASPGRAVNAASTRTPASAPRIVGAVSAQPTTSTTPSTHVTATKRPSATSTTNGSSGPRTPVSTPPGFQAQCHYETYPDRAVVPDPSCTPGVLNPGAVANPRGTICTAGYLRKQQPPNSYTEPLKIRDMVKYGSTGPPSAYQEDHVVPVQDGGSARDPKNLWPEYLYGTGGALQKDKAENRVHRLICSGKITVTQGARLLEGDWMQVLSSGPQPNR